MYLAWYDASKKLNNGEKIVNAYDRYVQKFGTRPREVLVAPGAGLDGKVVLGLNIMVRERQGISPNCFWIGTPEDNT